MRVFWLTLLVVCGISGPVMAQPSTWRELARERYRAIAPGFPSSSNPGYKGTGLEHWPSDGDLSARVRPLSTTIDMTQGVLDPSARAMDVAIDGAGFFVLSKPDGSLLYTRRGDFLWQDGVLESHDGYKVQVYPAAGEGETTSLNVGVGPSAIMFEAPPRGYKVDRLGRLAEWTIANGRPFVEDEKESRPIADFALASFPHPEFLGRAGDFNFVQLPAAGVVTLARARPGQIRPNCLEGSNSETSPRDNGPRLERMHAQWTEKATVRVAGAMPSPLSLALSQRGVIVVPGQPFSLVEGRSVRHFLNASADALANEELSDEESSLLLSIMTRVEPSLLIFDDKPADNKASPDQLGWSEMARSRIDILFRDLHNQFTPGFKARIPDAWPGDGVVSGARPELPETTLHLEQGKIFRTSEATNMAIDGPGFFVLRRPDGGTVYSRGGVFALREGFALADKDGNMPLFEPLGQPGAARPYRPTTRGSGSSFDRLEFDRLAVDDAGTLQGVRVQVDPVTGQEAQQMLPLAVPVLATFPHPEHLSGNGLLLEPSAASGEPRLATASALATRVLGQHLELSNVDFTTIGSMVGQEKERWDQVQAATVTCLGSPDNAFREALEKHGFAVVNHRRLTLVEARSTDDFFRACLRLAEDDALTDPQRGLVEKLMLALRPGLVEPAGVSRRGADDAAAKSGE